ncbi:MAG: hypothetical protein EBT39_03840 [Sphingobacteriia bacterium]|jgi:hypothetical protein|nr:hypothetical protein [Candidatus Fonsibacter lacus]
MWKTNQPFTSFQELNEYLELTIILIQRTQAQLLVVQSIQDGNLQDEVWKHLSNNLDTIIEGYTNAVLSIEGRLIN